MVSKHALFLCFYFTICLCGSGSRASTPNAGSSGAKYFRWSPDGRQMTGLVITNRPDTRKRGSGIIVLIDPVY
jgi:hypothetical protein